MQIHWTPGIGDPTLMGWLTVFAYFGAALFCVICARQSDIRNSAAAANTFHRNIWWLMAFALLALGINKQLDLQTLLTEIGRGLSKQQGWYEQRKAVQTYFIAGIASAGLFSLLLIGRAFHNSWKENRLALAGLVFLVSFILIRATSFHGVDRLLGLNFSGFKTNWLLELGGIAFIWTAAVAQLARSLQHRRHMPHECK